MDALKLFSATGDKSTGVTDQTAVRMAIAEALRDLADEIETGARVVAELQTSEMTAHALYPTSIMFMRSSLMKVPTTPAPPPKATP